VLNFLIFDLVCCEVCSFLVLSLIFPSPPSSQEFQQGKARQDKTRQDKTRQDKLKRNKTRQDKTRQDKTRQDKTRQDKTRQDKTRQDKTRQDKTRQDKTYIAIGNVSITSFILSTKGFTRRRRKGNRMENPKLPVYMPRFGLGLG
jgi:hypothetical protein